MEGVALYLSIYLWGKWINWNGLELLCMISTGTTSLIWLIISIDVAFTGPSFSGSLLVFVHVFYIKLWSCECIVTLFWSYFSSIMEGEESLQKFSPQVMIMQSSARSAVSLLPRIILFHGTSDYSIPSVERCVTNFIFNIGCMVNPYSCCFIWFPVLLGY